MIKPKGFINFIEKICMTFSIISLFAIMFFTTVDVLARKLFQYSIPALYELTSDYLMVTMVYLALSSVYVIGGHISITLFVDRLPKVIRPIMEKVLNFISFLLFCLITVVGWNTAIQAFQFNEVSSNSLAYPLGPALLLVPIGAGMLAIRIIQSLFFSKSFEKDREDNNEDVDISA